MNDTLHEQQLMSCVHCGLCLPSCPTYLETGSEADSPRGRIVLMRALHEGRLALNDPNATHHLDLCLGCRACETACPSGVPYGHLLETTREHQLEARARPAVMEAARSGLLETLTRPKAMTITMRFAQLLTGGGVPGSALRLLSGDPAPAPQRVSLPATLSPPLPVSVTPALGPRRFRVGVLTGCVMRVLFGDVNSDTVRVLTANGHEVLTNSRQECCGALHAHQGQMHAARERARALIDAFSPFDGLDAIVVNSAGCGSLMKDYGALLADDPRYAARAALFASKVRDIAEWLDETGWIAPLRPLPGAAVGDLVSIAYHDACHLAHGQGVRDAPRRLLARIPGAALVPLAESEVCCGSAGVYNLTEPDMARRLQSRKLQHIIDSGAGIVAAGNPGCLAWIQAGFDERGLPAPRIAHPVTLLAEALSP